MKILALGACDPRCPWCAAEFWRWVASRTSPPPAGRQRGKRAARSGDGEFAVAAATSIGADRTGWPEAP